jgi:hypothetical protein
LGALASLPRPWTPSPAPFGGSAANLQHPYTQRDWHHIGDPRLNYQTNSWVLQRASGPVPGPVSTLPAGQNTVYTSPTNLTKDAQQGLANTHLWWQTTSATNHFPTFAQGYRPSLPSGQPAMLSYKEFGFISAGRPWQTLRLFPQSGETNSEYADWRIMDYVDLGVVPRTTNSLGSIEIQGQININTLKQPTLAALLGNLSSPTNSAEMAANILDAAKAPMFRPSDLFSLTSATNPVVTNEHSLDFRKEELYGHIAPALTTLSSQFVVYALGQNLVDGNVRGTALLQAKIQLEPAGTPPNQQIIPRILSIQRIK